MSEKGYCDVLLGLQWGDEGKAKVIDLLSDQYDIVVRFQGGANAGHTVIFKGEKVVFHLLPSSLLHSKTIGIIGNGVAFDPEVFFKEISEIKKLGIDVQDRIFVSDKAIFVLPINKKIDFIKDKQNKIGTTKRGIGPTYSSKINRIGIKLYEIYSNDYKSRISNYLTAVGLKRGCKDYSENINFIEKYREKLFKYIKITELFLNYQLQKGRRILFEGAQGSGLDIDFGTYPFVTSSNTIISSIISGAGVNHHYIRKVFGLFKAYLTRVGNGPFPTELNDKNGKILQERGNEFGATTGRPRRCGWLDLTQIKYYSMLNGVTDLILSKIDILYNFEKINVCVDYKLKSEDELLQNNLINKDLKNNILNNNKNFQYSNNKDNHFLNKTNVKQIQNMYKDYDNFFPVSHLEYFEPIYREFRGFKNPGDKTFGDFIKYIERFTGIKISIISTGPGKNEYIKR